MSISVGPGQLERSLAAVLTKARAPFLTSKKREAEGREREREKKKRFLVGKEKIVGRIQFLKV